MVPSHANKVQSYFIIQFCQLGEATTMQSRPFRGHYVLVTMHVAFWDTSAEYIQ